MQKIDGRRDDLIDTYRPQLDNKMIHRIGVNQVACMNIKPANSSNRTWTTKEYSGIALPFMVNAPMPFRLFERCSSVMCRFSATNDALLLVSIPSL